MTLKLTPQSKRLIEKRIRSGGFKSAEQVVLAALTALDQQPAGEFEAGELDELLAEGEESIRRHGTLDGEKALANRRRRRARLRRAS